MTFLVLVALLLCCLCGLTEQFSRATVGSGLLGQLVPDHSDYGTRLRNICDPQLATHAVISGVVPCPDAVLRADTLGRHLPFDLQVSALAQTNGEVRAHLDE